MKKYRELGDRMMVKLSDEVIKALGARPGDLVYWVIDAGRCQLRKAQLR